MMRQASACSPSWVLRRRTSLHSSFYTKTSRLRRCDEARSRMPSRRLSAARSPVEFFFVCSVQLAKVGFGKRPKEFPDLTCREALFSRGIGTGRFDDEQTLLSYTKSTTWMPLTFLTALLLVILIAFLQVDCQNLDSQSCHVTQPSLPISHHPLSLTDNLVARCITSSAMWHIIFTRYLTRFSGIPHYRGLISS